MFSSCEDFIDLEPTDSISSEKAIRNEQELKSAIMGCYDALQSDGYYGRMLLVINEIASDNAYNAGTILEYDNYNKNNVHPDNTLNEDLWKAIYIGINRCNTAIYYTNKLNNISASKKEEYIAELSFLRALNYYNLTRLYKDIPLRLEPTLDEDNLNTPLSEQADIYVQILEDLSNANNRLTNSNPFFASDLAVKTLLAKVNLELKNYVTASNYADSVINGGKHLSAEYSELFFTEENDESIFELSYTELLSDKNRLAEYCLPKQFGGRFEIAPEEELINSFELNDKRRNLFPGTQSYCNKYESIASGADNIYIFRLAELYLLRAEAKANVTGNLYEIRNDINKIRNRAGIDSTFTTSYDELLLLIEEERRHEFAFEAHRWFDLIRTDRADDILGINQEQFHFPIPLSEINSNTAIN